MNMNNTNDAEVGDIWEAMTGPLFPEKPVPHFADITGGRFRRSKTRERIAKARGRQRIRPQTCPIEGRARRAGSNSTNPSGGHLPPR
jgi:hypothetical protein